MAPNDLRSPLSRRPDHGFVANISIGEPAVYQLVLIDTDYTWSRGIVSEDTLHFITSDNEVESVPNVAFGCGTYNYGDEFGYEYSGILGLGPSEASVMTQIGYQFSYCIGHIKDINDSYSHLIIGDEARLEGDSTPLEIFNSSYYAMLDGIRMGEKLIADKKVFSSQPKDGGGVLFDTGSPVTYLHKEALELLSAEIKSYMKAGNIQQVPEIKTGGLLCFEGRVSEDLENFTEVIFHFSGGADLAVGPDALFDQSRQRVFCMTILPTSANMSILDHEAENLTIIGISAMQDYNFGFDIKEKLVYVEDVDCKTLSDYD
ncbi:aspartyl protease UND-like [Nicotiana sylvestris]|uniref:Aspartic proteinase nepenthesin-2-like n=1 Tax=Nicotiana sylvestris TaxID=4096 RepID=A0A1U7XAH4_NICSY|nr:PREDICTED: aspartic proteinase nepenthesin-2-like [Nicotiana sylvestris]